MKKTLASIMLALILSLIVFAPTSSASLTKGVRTENLAVLYYTSPQAAFAALQIGDIDIMASPLSAEQYAVATTDPNIVLGLVQENDMHEFDLNNNATIATYPGVTSPTSYFEFRQALALLVDKNYIVNSICGGFADRIDVPVPKSAYSWANSSVVYPNYPYEYDPPAATAKLDEAGFLQGTTPNPYYDAGFPGSAQHIRTYPEYHPKAGQDLDPIIFYARSDGLQKLYAGMYLRDNMRKAGIPVDFRTGSLGVCYPAVFGERDYHIYTGGWALGRYPTYLYSLYGPEFWFPFGPNIVLPARATEGLKYEIKFECINVTDSKTGNNEFSIQLNYHLKLCNCTWLWVQCGYDVKYTGVPCSTQQVEVRQWYEIWQYDGTKWVDISGVQFWSQWMAKGHPCTFTLEVDSYIQGTKIIVSNATDTHEALDWGGGVCGEIVTEHDRKIPGTPERVATSPELVITGLQGGSTAEWGKGTRGWVKGWDSSGLDGTGKPKWDKPHSGAKVLDSNSNEKHSNDATAEKSHNLDWEWDEAEKKAKFSEKNCSYESGVGSYPKSLTPEYRDCLEELYHADNLSVAIAACRQLTSLHTRDCITIPLWSTKSYCAWRSWLLGTVNEVGCGPINDYTFMNAYKASGAPEQSILRLGITQLPQSHNILYAQSPYDYALLNRYWEGGQAVNPYDLATDQPWIVQDWTPTTWVDPDDGLNKTAVTYWLRKDVSWSAPVTGDYVRAFTAHDVQFSNMFSYAFDDGWNWNNAMDIDHIEIVDDYTYVVYFSAESIWLQYAANYPYLPKNEWEALFCTPATYTELGASYAAGDSLYIHGHKIAQIQSITANGAPFTDYWVRFNSEEHSANKIYFPNGVSGNLVINYLDITGDPHGYHPGSATHGYSWTDTSYSCGPYVLTYIDPTSYAVFKRNYYFFLETPPLGEIDWYWWWGARDTSRPLGGPRTGAFIVDIYDVTFACVSYGSRGYLEPTADPPWLPGADLAPSYTPTVPYGGEIDIYDVSTVLVNYGTEFGHPPTDP
jgi:ABC-type transport system substrate-binding protein